MGNISDDTVHCLQKQANLIRQDIIKSLVEAGSGHTAGALGLADIITYIYFHSMKHDPKKPDWEKRDMFVLSNGHVCPVLYAALAHAGYFDIEELMTLRKLGTRLQGHPHRDVLPGIETSSGPLGQGISQAIGMALGIRLDEGRSTDRFVYCIVGDGELNEGQNWEAIMHAAKEKLGNLIVVVDRNNIQIDGYTEDVMPLNDLTAKFKAFNWSVQEIDGHNMESIDDAFEKAKTNFEVPSVIIANTIPGQGVDDFERKPEWHGKPPSEAEGKMALKELRTLGGKIECDQIS